MLNHKLEPQTYPSNGDIYRKRLWKSNEDHEVGMSLKLIRLKQASVQKDLNTSKSNAKKP